MTPFNYRSPLPSATQHFFTFINISRRVAHVRAVVVTEIIRTSKLKVNITFLDISQHVAYVRIMLKSPKSRKFQNSNISQTHEKCLAAGGPNYGFLDNLFSMEGRGRRLSLGHMRNWLLNICMQALKQVSAFDIDWMKLYYCSMLKLTLGGWSNRFCHVC